MLGVKILAVGDLHLKDRELPRSTAILDSIITTVRDLKPDAVVLLGDTLHSFERVYTVVQCQAIKFLITLATTTKVYLLMGNHDRINNQDFLTDIHPFLALKYSAITNIVIVDKVIVDKVREQSFVFVPYTYPGRFLEALTTLGNDNWLTATCIFAHQEFYNAQVAYKVTSSKGDKWLATYPLVVSGHIHDYHQLQTNVLYIGTPVQQRFKERPDKTISLLIFNGTDYLETRIDLGLPKKLEKLITCQELAELVIPANVELKLIILGTAGELKDIFRHPRILELQAAGIKIATKIKTTTVTKVSETYKPKRFIECLYDSISSDSSLVATYKEVFQ